MKLLISFAANTLKELNPLENIRILHTNMRADILAGIMVAIIALPLGLAFGEISQLGPKAGIWSAIVGGVIGGLFGGSRVGVSGPTAPMASQIAVFMSAFVIGSSNKPDIEAAFSIIFLSGLILVAISILKISRFINYIPYPAIAGFMCGIGAIIVFSQINAFFGLESSNGIVDLIQNIDIHTLYVSIPSLLILLLWDSLGKKNIYISKVPSSFAALVTGSSIAYIMNLDIAYIGDKMNMVDSANIFSFHIPNLSRIPEFIGPAISLAGLAVLDSLLSCKVADNMTNLRHSSDRETFGQGLANMAAGLCGGISTATATTQTVGNIAFGARTPLSTIVKGLTLLAILSGLGYLVAAIPSACLAAILFKLGFEILDYRILPVLKNIPKGDLLIFIIVFLLTIFTDIMFAVAIGVLFAFIKNYKKIHWNYNHQNISLSNSDFKISGTNKAKLDELPINIIKPKGPLIFASTESLIDICSKSKENKLLIIDMAEVSMVDLTGIYTLEDILNNGKESNVQMFITGINANIEKTLVQVNFFNDISEDQYENSKESIASFISEKYIKV